MGDRCTGACCEAFPIQGIGATPQDIYTYLVTRALDGVQIAAMLIPLRALEPGAMLPNGDIAGLDVTRGWIFTCKHFDRESRNCGAYETRPTMCRDYPYGRPCEHGERCGWDRGRAGLWPPVLPVYHQLVADEAAESIEGTVRCKRRTHLLLVDAEGKPRQYAAEHERRLRECATA